jgi:deoxyribodipyrimidine photo-lyase
MINSALPDGIKTPINICWLRRDLRLNDNRALYHALKSSFPVLPVFIFDTHILNHLSDKKDKRIVFIHETIEQINTVLNENGASLLVLHYEPLAAFKNICSALDVREVFANHDYEPYAIKRDAAIQQFLLQKKILFHTYKDQVIFERSEVMKPDGTPYTVFTPYSKKWKQKYAEQKNIIYPSDKYLHRLLKTKPLAIPSLKEIGFEKINIHIPPLNIQESTIAHYHKTRNLPAINGTSYAGIHLRFGTVSVRQLVELACRFNEQWLNELIWREFFMMIIFNFPYVVNGSFKKKYDHIQWRNNEAEFELWCKGKTGYALVDAGMRQLNATGWMHNRVRMIAAGFLTKHLLIDWRWGEAYFAEKLIDYELASNNGNWQWAAGSGCDAAPYFRIFNPAAQAQKFDPQLAYIKTWIKDFKPGYLPPIVAHEFARKRALEVYKKSVKEI